MVKLICFVGEIVLNKPGLTPCHTGLFIWSANGLGGHGFGEFPRQLVHDCGYLLAKQDRGTPQIEVHLTHVSDHTNNPVYYKLQRNDINISSYDLISSYFAFPLT